MQRSAHSVDLELAQIGKLEVTLNERGGVVREVDRSRLGELLRALREADGVADRGVGHGQVLADRPHDDLA